jgi:hypothetical protein
MTPSCTKQNTANLVPTDPVGRFTFWRAYKAALVDAETHGLMELKHMAKIEVKQAMHAAVFDGVKLPDCRN